jgi:hypothetical protein
MADLDNLLTKLYARDEKLSTLEKTAEAALSESLRRTGQTQDNPYENMSLTELTKLASELEQSAAQQQSAEGEPSEEELEKVAFDMLGGQVMAHSMVHEFRLIKTAMVEGKCRVCKERAMDVEGSSICSTCLQEAQGAA